MGIFDSIKETLGLSSVDMEDAVKYAQTKPKIEKIIEHEYTNIEITDEYRRIKELIDQNCPITIHKSQGKTLPKIIDNTEGRSFATGQVYVALSRVTSLEDIKIVRPIKKNRDNLFRRCLKVQ